MYRFFLIFLFFLEIPVFGQPVITVSPQAGNLALSDVAKSVAYVPLETNENCKITTIGEFILSDNYVLLSNIEGFSKFSYYLFSRTGQFVTRIDIGDDELYAHVISINEKEKQVLLFVYIQQPEHKVQKLVYHGFDGQFIKSVDLPADYGISELKSFGGYFLGKSHNMGDTPFTYHIYDNNLKHIISRINPVPFTFQNRSAITYNFSEYIYNNRLHVKENLLNDTVYVINSDFSFTPEYVINAGDYEVTKEIRANNLFNMFSKLMIQTAMFETKDYLLFSYIYAKKYVYYYYHKADRQFIRFLSSTGIPNDYDGRFDFWPQYQYNDEFAAFYKADSFGENMDQLSRTIAPEDNPVLVVVKLK